MKYRIFSILFSICYISYVCADMRYNAKQNIFYSVPEEGIDHQEYMELIEIYWRAVAANVQANRGWYPEEMKKVFKGFIKYLQKEDTTTSSRLIQDLDKFDINVRLFLDTIHYRSLQLIGYR